MSMNPAGLATHRRYIWNLLSAPMNGALQSPRVIDLHQALMRLPVTDLSRVVGKFKKQCATFHPWTYLLRASKNPIPTPKASDDIG